MNKNDFEQINNFCKKIINDSTQLIDRQGEWLKINEGLFNYISIKPKNLPSIANCNFEGIRYQYISDFHDLYIQIQYNMEIMNHLPHDIAIMYFFEQMNLNMLSYYLNDEFYMNKDRKSFFYSLGNAFQKLHDKGNSKLIAQEMYCPSFDKMEYFFMGNVDNSYLHLIFKIENTKVIDLVESREIKSNLPIEIDPEKQVFLDTITPP